MNAIRNVLPPNSLKELQQFLGLANQYRSFVPNYAKIAGPLYELQSTKFKSSKLFLTSWNDAPHCLIADNAPEYSFLFDILKSEFGTIIQQSAAYHSRNHGQVERIHRTIQ